MRQAHEASAVTRLRLYEMLSFTILTRFNTKQLIMRKTVSEMNPLNKKTIARYASQFKRELSGSMRV